LRRIEPDEGKVTLVYVTTVPVVDRLVSPPPLSTVTALVT
jgi:hypothetical protein